MSKVTWLIEYRAGSYRFGRPRQDGELTDTSPTDPTDPASLVAAMQEAGYSGQPTMLAIPSSWCVSTSVVLASRRLARNRQAVAYALEERLPLSAEDIVYDFLAQDTFAFGVAADTSALLPIVRSLEEAGLEVATITPTAMLLLEHLAQRRRLPSDGVVLLGSGESCDFFVLAAARPQQWRCLPLDREVIARETAALLLAQANDLVLPVTAVNLSDEVAASLDNLGPEIGVTRQACDHDQALLAGAAEVLCRGQRPWIELRRDLIGEYDRYRLMRGSLRLLLLVVLITFVSLTTVARIRASRYQALTDALNNQKQALFQELFPEARVPTGIRSRLESERRMLVGMSVGNVQAPQLTSVTLRLVDALDALPTDLRFRLLEIRLEESSAYLEGEVRRHGDVDLLASSLRTRGFTVDPPRTEQLASEGVSFSLSLSTLPPPAEHE
ncbi:MAG: type II secretion system protein L [Pirellulaceae bacterium]